MLPESEPESDLLVLRPLGGTDDEITGVYLPLEEVAPEEDDLFVVKARHSAFYETPLAYLLGRLGAERLVLCGQVTEQCVLYSALDAHIRHFDVVVPRDAVAHIDGRLAEAALRMMSRNMSADVCEAAEVAFDD